MRSAWSILGTLAVLAALATGTNAQEKEVTLKGTILCAKCALKETKTCTTAIIVKEGEKKNTYYFKDKGMKEGYHEEVCGGDRKAGSVTGTVLEKDGKKWITPKKVEYAKKEGAISSVVPTQDSPALCCTDTAKTAARASICCNIPVQKTRTSCCCGH